jgi:hypothetical protein
MQNANNLQKIFSKNIILKDLEFLYDMALSENNLSCAIRIKSIQAQIMGLFNKKIKIPKLSEMNDEEIKNFLELNDLKLP